MITEYERWREAYVRDGDPEALERMLASWPPAAEQAAIAGVPAAAVAIPAGAGDAWRDVVAWAFTCRPACRELAEVEALRKLIQIAMAAAAVIAVLVVAGVLR